MISRHMNACHGSAADLVRVGPRGVPCECMWSGASDAEALSIQIPLDQYLHGDAFDQPPDATIHFGYHLAPTSDSHRSRSE